MMVFRSLLQPLPVEFPDPLAAPLPRPLAHADGARKCGWSAGCAWFHGFPSAFCGLRAAGLLFGLVLLCLLPRAIMGWKIGGICPDGVLYIQIAESFEQGSVSEALHRINFNLYPVILMLLHRCGLEWELAGKLWGIAISSLAVLPLYGWVRRQFDQRVAVIACFLYAAHPELVRWSPELIRDSTFWFLFVLSLYLLWRAVTEVGLRWYFCAGLAMALAAVTRFEGLFLLMPLALWSFWRGRKIAGHAPSERRALQRRLLLGAVLGASVLPALLALAGLFWLRGRAPWELIRGEPLEFVRHWGQSMAAMMTGGASVAGTPAWTRMLEQFAAAWFKGMTPLFLASMTVGLIGWWRVWRRREHQALFLMSLVLFLAIWIHLYTARESCNRYFLPMVLVMCPFAGLGLLACSARLRAWAADSSRVMASHFWPRAATLAPVLFVAAVSLTLALAADCRYRGDRAEVGRWARAQFGPSPAIFGPDGVTQVVNYYAQGQCESFSAAVSDEAVAAQVERAAPDVLLLPAARGANDRGEALLARMEELGFVPIDAAHFPDACRRTLVLTRRGTDPAAPARESASGLSTASRPTTTMH